MKINWKNGEKENKNTPKLGEIFMDTEKEEIMLMGEKYFSGGKSYFEYGSFKGQFHKRKTVLQSEFYNLRESEKIVKIEITDIEVERIY